MADSWPDMNGYNLASLHKDIREAVLELEESFNENGIPEKGDTSQLHDQRLGPFLHETYQKLAENPPGPLRSLRATSVSTLLSQLENDLSPIQFAHAEIMTGVEAAIEDQEVAAGVTLGGKTTIKAWFSEQSQSTVSLRLDQMLGARFWRIGFAFENRELTDEWIGILVRNATRRLASDLLSLERVLAQFKPVSRTRIIPVPAERRFEHLILDILNEDVHRARIAPLAEDVLEKTDIRVSYPQVGRKRGARVQVTSITDADLHQSKLGAIRRYEEFVFLSPLSLAEFACQSENSDLLLPLLDVLRLYPDCPEDHTTVPELALELKRALSRASARPSDTPIGPLTQVPVSVRELIRRFVEIRALASTNTLRARQSENEP